MKIICISVHSLDSLTSIQKIENIKIIFYMYICIKYIEYQINGISVDSLLTFNKICNLFNLRSNKIQTFHT